MNRTFGRISMHTDEGLQEARALARRLDRAEALAKAGVGAVTPMNGAYLVASEDGLRKYLVTEGGRCACPDWEYRHGLHHGLCKHVLAAQVFEEARRAEAARQGRRRRARRPTARPPVHAAA